MFNVINNSKIKLFSNFIETAELNSEESTFEAIFYPQTDFLVKIMLVNFIFELGDPKIIYRNTT